MNGHAECANQLMTNSIYAAQTVFKQSITITTSTSTCLYKKTNLT